MTDLTFTNQKEIRVAALQRSGHHAIIHWIVAQIKAAQQKAIHINNVRPGRNPFLVQGHQSKNAAFYISKDASIDWASEGKGRLTPKETLIYSYEDCWLDEITGSKWESQITQWVGPSHRRYNVLILRDPFNWFASRLRRGGPNSWQSSNVSTSSTRLGRSHDQQLWIQYAREFLGETRYLAKSPLVPINFNRWFEDASYRRHIAQKLDIPFTDAGFQKQASLSSFDGSELAAGAQRMQVLRRWSGYSGNSFYRDFFRSPVRELAQSIFGRPPLADAWFPSGNACSAFPRWLLRWGARWHFAVFALHLQIDSRLGSAGRWLKKSYPRFFAQSRRVLTQSGYRPPTRTGTRD